jgi:hypothetical protein
MTIFNYEDFGDTNILNEKHGGTKRFFFQIMKIIISTSVH